MRRRFTSMRMCAALAAIAALALIAVASPHVALELGPAFALAVVLLFGVFPGENALDRARTRRLGRRRTFAARSISAPSLPDVARPVGIALAFALAMRPPPAVAPGTR